MCFATNPKQDIPQEQYTVQAKITEVENGSFLVAPVEGSPELSSSDLFRVPITNMPSSPEPLVGDVVEITYDGSILESYPAQFSTIYSMKVVSREKPSEIDAADTVDGQKLTLNDVVTLSQKGDALSWSDFERYQGQEIGSGLYIMRYEIDELFDVLVGGIPEETPMYIRLRNQSINAWVELREDGVERVNAFIETYKNDSPGIAEPKPTPEELDFSTLSAEQTAVRQAILEHNRSAAPTGFVSSASFAELACIVEDWSDFSRYTYYGWALYEEYKVTDSGLETVRGRHIPVAITLREEPSGTPTLEEYWEPRDGSYFAQDVREKFPVYAAEDGIDSQKFILRQEQECYVQAIASAGLDASKVIGTLIETICNSPALSSNPEDYINEHSIEYRELTYYGRYTLKYCFDRFEKGGEIGLDGQIMAQVCEDIAVSWGEDGLRLLVCETPADGVITGQLWYNALKNNALRLMEQYSEMELAERYPASYLLLNMLGEV